MTHHHHEKNSQESLSFEEKMIKRLTHWIKHNIDHAQTYRDWAQRLRDNHMPEAGAVLEKAARETLLVNQSFENARAIIHSTGVQGESD